MSWIDPLLLTSVRTSSPVMEPKGTEDDDGKDDQQHEEQGRPVSDDHNWRIRFVDALPENYHSYHHSKLASNIFFVSKLQQILKRLFLA